MDGTQARALRIWVQAEEGASLKGGSYAPSRHNRGVSDVLIVEGAPPAPERSARGNATG